MTGIVIGKILTAHGVRGLVKFRSYMDDIGDLPDYNPVTCADGREINLSIKNSAGGEYIAEIVGIVDRTIAESFRNQEIFVSREKLPETQSDEFYIDDLIGLEILDVSQQKIGVIKNIVNFGASDLFEIKHENGKLFYCPMTEPYLVTIDLETSLIVIQDFEEFII